MKIVVLDGYTLNPGDLSWDRLSHFGNLKVFERTSVGDILERVGDAEVIFTNKTPLSRETLAALPSVKYVGVLATGYNVVDVGAAKELGITVTNIPTYGTDAVAQFVFALLLEICHHVGSHSEAVKAGDWAKCPDFCFWNYPLIELVGKTIGIIGYGRIGQATGKIAQAFGMRVLAYDMYPDDKLESETMRYSDLDTVLAGADIISLHCPLTESNQEMINEDSISTMKDGVIIINTARGPLINEADLAAALASGKVAGVAVDVLSSEPASIDNPLIHAPNCIVTPHIAWAPRESRERLMNIAVDSLKSFLDGQSVNVVS